jgi:3-deoxy-D-manno-octulosonic acid (KDO) 8-phosphate synthase
MLKFLKSGSNFKVKVTRNIHMEYESPITYHSKDMANVKVFVDRQTDRPKTICPRFFDTGA